MARNGDDTKISISALKEKNAVGLDSSHHISLACWKLVVHSFLILVLGYYRGTTMLRSYLGSPSLLDIEFDS